MSLIKDTLASGIKPIVLEYEDVRLFDGKSGLVRSFLVINSLELGVLTYREYRFVARRTKQGNHLVKRHIHKLCRAIPRIIAERQDIKCFSLPVYARLLRDGVLADMIVEALAIYPDVSPSMLCVELSADLLYENLDDAMIEIDRIRELGVKVAIGEVGDEYCPVFRLSRIPFEYAFIDGYSTSSLEGNEAERVAGSLAKYLHYLGVKVIAPGLDTEEKIAKAKEVGCDGYTEALYAEYTREPSPEIHTTEAEATAEETTEAEATEAIESSSGEEQPAETAELSPFESAIKPLEIPEAEATAEETTEAEATAEETAEAEATAEETTEAEATAEETTEAEATAEEKTTEAEAAAEETAEAEATAEKTTEAEATSKEIDEVTTTAKDEDEDSGARAELSPFESAIKRLVLSDESAPAVTETTGENIEEVGEG